MADNLRVAMIEPQRITAEEWADLLESAPTENPAEFRIDSDERAEWLLRKVADCQARAARAKAWAEREVEQAEAEEARLLARFSAELEEYSKVRLANGKGKKKSFDLPSGRLGFRTNAAHLKVIDDAKALAWAKINAPSAVVTVPATEKLSRAELALAFKNGVAGAAGEIPSGAEFVEAKEDFYISQPKAKEE